MAYGVESSEVSWSAEEWVELDQAFTDANNALTRATINVTEAQEAITAVRSQRDASLEMLRKYEAERFSYRMQSYAFGFILGALVTYGVLS